MQKSLKLDLNNSTLRQVAIAVQIRDGNTRLPGKGSMKLHNKPVWQHCLYNLIRARDYINARSSVHNTSVSIFFLCPYGERAAWLSRLYENDHKDIVVIGGLERNDSNVFWRYEKLYTTYKPDYIVRITADCPFIPSALITKAITMSVNHRLDYISNVDEKYRTMPDGHDVEVISQECFLWLKSNIHKGSEADLEHVTTYIRNNAPKWLRMAVISGVLDLSSQKFSLDTQADFDLLEAAIKQKIQKDGLAKKAGLGIYEY